MFPVYRKSNGEEHKPEEGDSDKFFNKIRTDVINKNQAKSKIYQHHARVLLFLILYQYNICCTK